MRLQAYSRSSNHKQRQRPAGRWRCHSDRFNRPVTLIKPPAQPVVSDLIQVRMEPGLQTQMYGVRLPLRQLPDLWLGVTGAHADLSKYDDSLLEMCHRLFGPAGCMQQVGQVVVQRGFAMAVAHPLA